ncbi:hypothetical protein AVEN_119799-1 [Araneus ventricosus]|uniref:Tc1-like transposase DDE domain-containing protein n=1 Tax=Araneus ventricosus TaxID=182803 RepID=A0A4Y2TJE8_ARAVE|nr:hypothetical protein AVEN_119799-1 [Araneus ventricosus]
MKAGSSDDDRVLTRRRPGEHLQPTCLRPRHIGPTSGVMVGGAISYDSRSTFVVIPRTLTANLYVSGDSTCCATIHEQHSGGVFQQNNGRPHTAVVTQHTLQSVDMLPWPARSPDLSPIEHVWDINGTTTPSSSKISIYRPFTHRPSATGMELHPTN